jgi:predicted ATPase
VSLVIGGVCKPTLLDSYSVERSAVGDRLLRNASRMTDAAVMRNPIAQGLRNAVVKFAFEFPQLGHRAANTLAELDIGYPESPPDGDGRASLDGNKRWPDRLPADIAKARFTAIGPAEIAAGLAATFPLLVQAAPASGQANAQDLTLVRPDGYVGFAGAAADRTGAEAYLKALAAR